MTINVTPTELATRVATVRDAALVAFDIDGVLAPIVEHADEAELVPGVHELLAALAERCEVAVLSGRSLESIERVFALPATVHVVGSHGLEARGGAPLALTADEQAVLAAVTELADRAAITAGDGAWVEHKPASRVLHVRTADPNLAGPAIDDLLEQVVGLVGANVKAGHAVVELLARPTSKGDALMALAERLDRATIVYFGDDLTDEDAFVAMGDDDYSVRVGMGDTAARFRVPDPHAVREFLELLGWL